MPDGEKLVPADLPNSYCGAGALPRMGDNRSRQRHEEGRPVSTQRPGIGSFTLAGTPSGRNLAVPSPNRVWGKAPQ
jgi:hypothetical protein